MITEGAASIERVMSVWIRATPLGSNKTPAPYPDLHYKIMGWRKCQLSPFHSASRCVEDHCGLVLEINAPPAGKPKVFTVRWYSEQKYVSVNPSIWRTFSLHQFSSPDFSWIRRRFNDSEFCSCPLDSNEVVHLLIWVILPWWFLLVLMAKWFIKPQQCDGI